MHWIALIIVVVPAALLALVYGLWIRSRRPPENIGNGIVVGLAKAFDNRSLALKIERLNAALETLKIVNQNVTESGPPAGH